MRKHEYDILVAIRKAKKLRWLLLSSQEHAKKEELLRRVKVPPVDAG